MLRMNLQFFAHKKGVGSTKNGRDSESNSISKSRYCRGAEKFLFLIIIM